MRLHYDTIYLSPHLDDVALSCGGQIFAQTAVGKAVLIVTMMAGDPPGGSVSSFAGRLHARWQLAADVVAERREEDAAACRILGADYAHWDVPDCIYRRHPKTGEPLYSSEADIFGAIDLADRMLADQLSRRMSRLPGHEGVVVPLGAGHHVDHQLVRLVAERLWPPEALKYYEDYPYAGDSAALSAVIPAGDSRWMAEVIPLDEADIAARVAAVAAYRSQVSTFFSGRSDMERQIKSYIRQVGGERLWHRLKKSVNRDESL